MHLLQRSLLAFLILIALMVHPALAQFADVSWDYLPKPLAAVPGQETTLTLLYRNTGPDGFQPTAPLGRVTFGAIEIVSVEANPAPGVTCEMMVDPQRGNIVLCHTPAPVTIAAGTEIAVDVVFIAPATEAVIEAEAFPSSQLEPMDNNRIDIPVTPLEEGEATLRTAITVLTNPVPRGGVLRIEYVITNEGPGDVAAFEQTTNLSRELGLQLEHISTMPEAPCSLATDVNFRCQFGPLAVGAQAVISLAVPVPLEMEEGEYGTVSRALTAGKDHPFTTVLFTVQGEAALPQVQVEMDCSEEGGNKRQDDLCTGRVEEDRLITLTIAGDAVSNLSLNLTTRFRKHTDNEMLAALEEVNRPLFSYPLNCQGIFAVTCAGLEKGEDDLVITITLNVPLADLVDLTLEVWDDDRVSQLAAAEIGAVIFPRLQLDLDLSESGTPNLVIPVDVANQGSVDEVEEGAYSFIVTINGEPLTYTGASGDFEAEDQGGGQVEARLAGDLEPEEEARSRLVFSGATPGQRFDLDVRCNWFDGVEEHEDPACPETTTVTIVDPMQIQVTKETNNPFPPRAKETPYFEPSSSFNYTIQITTSNPGERAVVEDYMDPALDLSSRDLPDTCARQVDTNFGEKFYLCNVELPAELTFPRILARDKGILLNRVVVRVGGNRVATDEVVVDVQALSVTAKPALTTVRVGELLSIEVRTTNVGSQDAPQFLTFLATSSTARPISLDDDCRNISSSAVICEGRALPVGESRSIFIPIQILSVKKFEGLASAYSVTHSDAVAAVEPFLVFPNDDGRQQLINATGSGGGKQAAAVDVYLDGTLVAANVAPGTATSFLETPLEQVTPLLQIRAAGAPESSDPLTSFTVDLLGLPEDTLAFSTRNVLMLADTPGYTLGLVVKKKARLEAEDPAKADVFFVHASPDAPALSIAVSSFDAPAQTLSFGETSDYLALDPGPYFLIVNDAATGEAVDIIRFDVSGEAGHTVALMLSGRIADDTFGLFAFDDAGVVVPTPVEEAVALPVRFVLHGNNPNPFNLTTTILYDVPFRADVQLQVYDMLGRQVATLVDAQQGPGSYRVSFDTHGLPSGVYAYVMQAGSYRAVRTMMLVK